MGIMDLAGKISKAAFGDVHILDALTNNLDDLAGGAVRNKTGNALKEVLEAGVAGAKLDKKKLAEANKYVADTVKDFKTGGGAISDIIDAYKKTEYFNASNSKGFQKAFDRYSNAEKTGLFNKYADFLEAGANEGAAATFFGRKEGSQGIGLARTAGAYFGDAEYGAVRKKAIAAGAVGVGVGMRYLQGGTLTQRPNGENDIAGIPFF